MKYKISFLAITISFLLMTACKDEGFFSEEVPADALNALTNAGNAPEFSLDWINKVQVAQGENSVQGDDLEIVGWAMDTSHTQLVSKVYLTMNGVLFTTEYGIERNDVADYFKNPAIQKCGFRAKFSRSLFKPGIYSVGVIVVGADNTSYFSSPAERSVLLKL